MLDESEDPSGCVKSQTRSFSCDFLDQLISWNDAQQSSASGTCSLETIGSMAGAFTYVTGTDQIASQWSPSASGVLKYAFGYDIQGNISAVGQYDATGSSLSQSICLRHDALGRLVLAGYTSSTFTPGGTICSTDAEVTTALARFKYDARNRRIARQVDGTWTYIISDASGNPLSKFTKTSDSTNPWVKVRDYVWLDGRLLAQIEYVGTSGTAYVYYAHVDHLGTPHALTNPSGELVWSTYQRPYGEVGEKTVTDPLSGQTVATNLRLPGQYDERVFAKAGIDMQGPYYNWNRWYLPSVGRYLEADPIALGGDMNTEFGPDWYNYALGNPLAYYDRDGRNAGVLAGFMCGPPCAVAGFLAVAGATAVLAKATADAVKECKKPKPNKNCGCTCLKSSGERQYIGIMRDDECRATCVVDNFNGYQCGGAPQWPYLPF